MGKYIRMKEKGFIQAIKEGLLCWDKRITANLYIWTDDIPGEN